MLEQLGDRVKRGLREWTERMAGQGGSGAAADGSDRFSALARTKNEYGVDPFGFDREFSLAALAPFIWLYRHYHRVEVHGIEQVPPGRVLLVSNHSGQLPMDGAMIGVAMVLEARPPRFIRSLVDKWVPALPYVSTFMARMGQIVGTPENCRRLLNAGEAILVFPEGTRGIAKLWPQRYQLQDFGLGFMRLALETDTPIVPVAVVGAEEQAPALLDIKPLARLLGMPAFPVTPTGIPFPLPTKYRIYFGEPLRFKGRADDEDSELDKKVRTVKAAIQTMLNRGLREREGVFR
jgi:1-acyl-sn-glycerol-3-phosphate acyltransferase